MKTTENRLLEAKARAAEVWIEGRGSLDGFRDAWADIEIQTLVDVYQAQKAETAKAIDAMTPDEYRAWKKQKEQEHEHHI